ncbi:MAG TPA: hypothetical protein VFD32_17590 [Dehalococcoidia bacterium]|nr:hypothetical protein [Dehalococcoidia bacterium]
MKDRVAQLVESARSFFGYVVWQLVDDRVQFGFRYHGYRISWLSRSSGSLPLIRTNL